MMMMMRYEGMTAIASLPEDTNGNCEGDKFGQTKSTTEEE